MFFSPSGEGERQEQLVEELDMEQTNNTNFALLWWSGSYFYE